MFKAMRKKQAIRENTAPAKEVPLQAEEIEAVIAPKLIANHNENVLAARLDGEEMEAVIAPKLVANHNETILE